MINLLIKVNIITLIIKKINHSQSICNCTDELILAKIARTNACYEWIVDSLSLDKIKSLATYLFDTTPSEAANLGVPDEYLTEENEDETDVSQDKGE